MPPNADELKHRLDDGGHQQRDQRRGNALKVPRTDGQYREGEQRETGGGEADRGQCFVERPQLFVEMQARRPGRQAEEILPLTDENDDADARGETDDYRVRDVFNDRAQAGETERDEDHARHQRGDLQTRNPVLRRDDGQYGDECAGRARNLHPRSAEERSEDSGDDRGIQTLLGARAAGDCEGHGQGQRHDADDDARDHVVAYVGAGP